MLVVATSSGKPRNLASGAPISWRQGRGGGGERAVAEPINYSFPGKGQMSCEYIVVMPFLMFAMPAICDQIAGITLTHYYIRSRPISSSFPATFFAGNSSESFYFVLRLF